LITLLQQANIKPTLTLTNTPIGLGPPGIESVRRVKGSELSLCLSPQQCQVNMKGGPTLLERPVQNLQPTPTPTGEPPLRDTVYRLVGWM
jgi:hypothetical protein